MSPISLATDDDTMLDCKQPDSCKAYRPAWQSRNLRSEQRFLNAAGDLFVEQDNAATRVAVIITHSKCSTGSFYHRFTDKDELFTVMLQRYLTDARHGLAQFDLAISSGKNLFNLFIDLTTRTHKLIATKKSIYITARQRIRRAAGRWNELARQTVLPKQQLAAASPHHAYQISAQNPAMAMRQARQLVVVTCLQTKLGDGPLLPQDQNELATLFAHAACGITPAAGAESL